MTETLLSPSNVLLFGRKVGDLEIVEPLVLPRGVTKQVKAASTKAEDVTKVMTELDGVKVKPGNRILLKDQGGTGENNGIYRIGDDKKPGKVPNALPDDNVKNFNVYVRRGKDNGGKLFSLGKDGSSSAQETEDARHGPFAEQRTGLMSQLEQQLHADLDPSFARIYGFSFEGVYYDLPQPVLFLVHGDGVPASEVGLAGAAIARRSRAPRDPSLTGVGAADYQLSDDIAVWSYDQADYTIRMDVETGMFEQVLLDAELADGGDGIAARGMHARGMHARGMHARGMHARGMHARGMHARGMHARGGNSD